MAERLTSDLIEARAAPAKGAITIWDDHPKASGFGVRIFAPTAKHPAGARSFFLNYRVDGMERRYTIGAFPRWSVTAARDEAIALRKRIDRGEDPAQQKREQREAPTVQDLLDRYEEDHLPTKAAQGARLNDEKRMLGLIGDALGRQRKVAEIHFGDIEAMHRQITEERGPKRANRVLSIASKAFSLALRPRAGDSKPWRDAAAGNPCKGVKRNHEDPKERFLSPAEIAALTDALAEHTDGAAANCIRFIMLTGCRPGEAMKATWAQMDEEPGYWVKPAANTKQRRIHKAPLSPPALALLAQLRTARDSENPYVFAGQVRKGRRHAPITQTWSVWYAARDRATLALWAASTDERVSTLMAELALAFGRQPTIAEAQSEAKRRGVALPSGLLDARQYDLRHTFASVGAGGGLSLPIIGKLLGHTQARTTQRYAHLADDPLKEATKTIGAVITGAAQPARSADVVPLKG